jgi:hypothetical protein
MGRGAAKQATELVKGVDKDFGDKIKKFEILYPKEMYFYGYMEHDVEPLAILQVKNFWGSQASLTLIKRSLNKFVNCMNKNKLYRMNFPGIGYGGLEVKEVLPLLQFLPDNVTICYK